MRRRVRNVGEALSRAQSEVACPSCTLLQPPGQKCTLCGAALNGGGSSSGAGAGAGSAGTPAKRKSPAPKPSSSKKPYVERKPAAKPAGQPTIRGFFGGKSPAAKAAERRAAEIQLPRRARAGRRGLAAAAPAAAAFNDDDTDVDDASPAPAPPAAAPHPRTAAPAAAPAAPPRRRRPSPSDLALPAAKYDPLSPCWRIAAAPLPYAHVAQALDALEATRSRLAKETILLNTFRAALAMRRHRSASRRSRTCWRR